MAIEINEKTRKQLDTISKIGQSSNIIMSEVNDNKQKITTASTSIDNSAKEISTNITKFDESLEKDRSFFKNITAPISKVADLFNSLPKEELYHRQLIDLITQLKSTEIIINSNSEELGELAKNNEDVANLLTILSSSSDSREKLLEKILDRQEFSVEEASELLSSLDSAVDVLGKVNSTLSINLEDIVGQYNNLITDGRIDLDQKKKLLEEIKKYTKDSGINSQAIEELNKLNVNNLKFTKEGNVQISRLLSKIAEETKGVKIQGSLKELNDKYDKSILTQKEVNKVLTSPVKAGEEKKTFRERFLEKPGLYTAGKEIKTGGIGLALNLLGLSGLEQFGAVEKISDFLSVDTLKKAGGLFKRKEKEPEEDIDIKIQPTVQKVTGSIEEVSNNLIENTIPTFEGTTESAINLSKALEFATKASIENTEAVSNNREALAESVEDFSESLGKENKGLTKSLKKFKSSIDESTKTGLFKSLIDRIKPSGTGLLSKIPGVGKLLGKVPGVGGLGKGLGLATKVGGLGKGLGLATKVGGIGSFLTGGAGLGGLLTTGVGGISSLGAGAMATSAGLVGLAGLAGAGIGTLASKGIDKLLGRGKGGLGDLIFEKIYGKEGITGKGQEKLQKAEEQALARFKSIMSSDAFNLLGDEPSNVAVRFTTLKNQGSIIKFEDKWLTNEEFEQVKAEKLEEEDKAAEQITEEKAKAIEVKEPEITAEIPGKILEDEDGKEIPGVKPMAEITTAKPTVSPEITAISKQIGAMAQTMTSMIATIGGANIGQTKQGTGRTKVIDDFGIAFFNSMIFE